VFAGDLRAAGHVVHTPDLYDGKTFTDLAAGLGYAKQTGFDTIIERGRLASDGSPGQPRTQRCSCTPVIDTCSLTTACTTTTRAPRPY